MRHRTGTAPVPFGNIPGVRGILTVVILEPGTVIGTVLARKPTLNVIRIVLDKPVDVLTHELTDFVVGVSYSNWFRRVKGRSLGKHSTGIVIGVFHREKILRTACFGYDPFPSEGEITL